MNSRTIGLPSDKDLRASADALSEAALQARELARQTGTGLAIFRNGKLMIVTADELDRMDAESANEIQNK